MTTTTRTRPAPTAGEAADNRSVWLGRGLAALAVGLAVNSVLGPFVADRLDYPVSETMRNRWPRSVFDGGGPGPRPCTGVRSAGSCSSASRSP